MLRIYLSVSPLGLCLLRHEKKCRLVEHIVLQRTPLFLGMPRIKSHCLVLNDSRKMKVVQAAEAVCTNYLVLLY